MRLVFLAFYLSSFLLDAFLSCSGSKPPVPTKTMSFSVDGQKYTASANL
ncbi:hypothetical protein [Hymenobacter sp. DG01]|nr:hypothetical protein [Hymenobacter sp. DG01]